MRGVSWFPVGTRVCLASFALLAIGADARADVIRPNINYTYTTTGPGPISGPTGAPVIEFRGVENGMAAVGDDVKLGTLLVHPQDPSGGHTFFNGNRLLLKFQITGMEGPTISLDAPPIFISNGLYGSVYPDGTFEAGVALFMELATSSDPWNGYANQDISFPAYYMKLNLGAVHGGNVALWNLPPGSPVAEIDVYGHLKVVPEPSTWAIFTMAAAGAWWSRKRRAGRN